MVRLGTETKQIIHAIRMVACNAETIPGLVLDGAGLRHLRAVVARLRDGDRAGEQR